MYVVLPHSKRIVLRYDSSFKNPITMARCTKEEALETRNRILDAAENVFHEKGVGRTSLADVASAANVTRGAIYWHFKNKGDLFDAMFERVRLPMEAMVEAGGEAGGEDPLGRLRATCAFLFRETAQNTHSHKVFDILFHKCELVDKDDPIAIRLRECFLQATKDLERILRNAIDREQLPSDLDIELATIALHAHIDGLLKYWLFSPDRFDLAGNAEKLADACIDTLRFSPALRR